jgi:hypothetical protein
MILLLQCLIAFLVRAYPHISVIDVLGAEEASLYVSCLRILSGDFSKLGSYPHTAIFLTIILKSLTRISLISAVKVYSPLISAITTFVLYKTLNESLTIPRFESSLVTWVFVFLDSHIYRSTEYTGSAEVTAILLTTIFFYLWFDERTMYALLVLPFILITHLIVFILPATYIFSCIITNNRTTTKQKALGLVTIAGILLIMSPFLPIDYALQHVLNGFDISILTLITKYGQADFDIVMSSLFGTATLFVGFGILMPILLKLIKIDINIKQLTTTNWLYILGLVTLTAINTTVISPYRLFSHVGILGLFSLSLFFIPTPDKHFNREKSFLTIMLCGLMFTQVITTGWYQHNWIHAYGTDEEIVMIEWLTDYHFKEFDEKLCYSQLFWDDSGVALSLYTNPPPLSLDPFNLTNQNNTNTNNGTSTNNNTQDYNNYTKDYNMWFSWITVKQKMINGTFSPEELHEVFVYVMYSDRFSEQALFRLPNDSDRLVYSTYEIPDYWIGHPDWELIYNDIGGKIYRNIYYFGGGYVQ